MKSTRCNQAPVRLMKFTLLISLFLLTLGGCCTLGPNPQDPFETLNRGTFAFNDTLDKVILKPTATIYRTIVPAVVVTGITNFFSNLSELPTIANDLLQANFLFALSDSWRLFVNSTFGIVGFVDVASHMNLPPHSTDFGITLAKWGIKDSPYLVIPILGPSTIRDAIGIPVDYYAFTVYPYIHPLKDRYILLGVALVNMRANLLDYQGMLQQVMIDPYTFQRDAYLQRRQFMVDQSKKSL